MSVYAIRGAITIDVDTPEEIKKKTSRLLKTVVDRNALDLNNVVSIFFTATKDVKSLPPAVAAREMGMTEIPLLCCQEMYVEEGLKKCIRILFHVNAPSPQVEPTHVFLRGATVLRPEFVEPGDESD